MISMPTPLNNSVINLPHLYLVSHHSSSSSQNIPRDNRCFNIKESNSNTNDLSSPVIPVPPPLDDLVIISPQLSSVSQKSSRSSYNTTHELQASSITGPTYPVPPPSTKNGSHNIYGCIVAVYRLTLEQRQPYAVMLLQYYHELSNTNEPLLMCAYPPPITNI